MTYCSYEHLIQKHFLQGAKLRQELAENQDVMAKICQVAVACVNTMSSGHKVLLAGNGGSAADAEHIAAEFVGRFEQERGGLPAIALTASSALTTAISNDYGYEQLFARQLQALAKQGDLVLFLSSSGNSKNILLAADTCQALGICSVAICSHHGKLPEKTDLAILINESNTALIQEMTIAIGHILCRIVEQEFTTKARSNPAVTPLRKFG